MVQNEYEHLQIAVQSFMLVMAWSLYNVLCNIDLQGTVTPVHIILIQLFHLLQFVSAHIHFEPLELGIQH
jgi:hypothetical protein